jgi:hypothetical protein
VAVAQENTQIVLLSSGVRIIVIVSFSAIHSWTVFLVAVEYFQEGSSFEFQSAACVGLKEGNRMSRKNGDRSRFDRQRKAKIHSRTQIRELWKTIRPQETTSSKNAGQSAKAQGSSKTTKKSAIESVVKGA